MLDLCLPSSCPALQGEKREGKRSIVLRYTTFTTVAPGFMPAVQSVVQTASCWPDIKVLQPTVCRVQPSLVPHWWWSICSDGSAVISPCLIDFMPKGTVENCGMGQHEKMRLPTQSAIASWMTGQILVLPARHYDSPRWRGGVTRWPSCRPLLLDYRQCRNQCQHTRQVDLKQPTTPGNMLARLTRR